MFSSVWATSISIVKTPSKRKAISNGRWLRPVLGVAPVQNFLKRRIARSVRGPSDDRRKNTGCQLWGEVASADARRLSATMNTPNGYDLTVTASLGIVEYLLDHDVEGGFYTPSLLMGAGYAASLPGVVMKPGSLER